MSAVAKKDMSHLKKWQWKKGQSGNPKGSHKAYSIRSQLRRLLETRAPKTVMRKMAELGVDIEDLSNGDLIVIRLVWLAQEGNLKAIKEVLKHADLPQIAAVSGDAGDVSGTVINLNIVKSPPAITLATDAVREIKT